MSGDKYIADDFSQFGGVEDASRDHGESIDLLRLTTLWKEVGGLRLRADKADLYVLVAAFYFNTLPSQTTPEQCKQIKEATYAIAYGRLTS